MALKATERIAWAVETLAPSPDDAILEVGCGHGVAVSLVCERLRRGTITAIDRSQKMIDMATRRNQAYVEVGKAKFICSTLEGAVWGRAHFDKIFAIRVNFFIQQPAQQLPILKRLLKPAGALYLFLDPPMATQVAPFVEMATQYLTMHRFTIHTIHPPLDTGQGMCIIAQPQ